MWLYCSLIHAFPSAPLLLLQLSCFLSLGVSILLFSSCAFRLPYFVCSFALSSLSFFLSSFFSCALSLLLNCYSSFCPLFSLALSVWMVFFGFFLSLLRFSLFSRSLSLFFFLFLRSQLSSVKLSFLFAMPFSLAECSADYYVNVGKPPHAFGQSLQSPRP